MQLESYDWVSTDLIEQAKEIVAKIENEVADYYFFPLAEHSSTGCYPLLKFPAHISLNKLPPGYHYLRAVEDASFKEFLETAILTRRTLKDFLLAVVTYCLAHGIDMVRRESVDHGVSIFTSFPHWALYGSGEESYETG
jgi:hypothetical protein